MAISNAERQAQHRERLKAKRTIMDELVISTRRNLREWRRSAALLTAGSMRVGWNGEDQSGEHVLRLNKIINENQHLVDQYDPEGLLKDDDIEIGDVDDCLASQLWHGRHVSYLLDEQGRAYDIMAYNDIISAKADSGAASCRYFGTIGAEGWSITPPAAAPHRS
jgi:hypothetical protein